MLNPKLLSDRLRLPARQTESGFTLLEMMIVVVVLATISAIALPSWVAFGSKRQANIALTEIYQALQQAQVQADNRQLPHTITFRNHPQRRIPQYAIVTNSSVSNIAENQWITIAQAQGIGAGRLTVNSVSISFDSRGTAEPSSVGKNIVLSISPSQSSMCVRVASLLGELRRLEGSSDCSI